MQTPPSTLEPSALPGPFVTSAIAYWAAKTPTQQALIGPGATWTYEELERRSNRLAWTLRSMGVHAGDRVAFVLPRGPETVLLLTSILKAGAAYVPIASDSPPQRIQDCLEDAQPSLVISETGVHTTDTAPAETLRGLLERSLDYPESPLPPDWTDQDLAYMIFTSGTTGRPKGVPISHASLSNFVNGDQEACIRVKSEDRVFQGFSPASDGHHEEVWPTFLAGATLVVATNNEVYSGDELANFLDKHGVTIISCAPTLLTTVDRDLPKLRRILFGAENLPLSIVKRWWAPNRTILNTYGPTEATVGATFSKCDPEGPITIGKPLPGYACHVVDEHLNLVDDGLEGELTIAGVGVASGYYNRPEASEGRFVPNPFGEGTLYRTGDRVRRNPDGNLVWLGRIDAQVKIRGHRIELSEIEGHVLATPWIQSGAVIARQIDEHESQLVALVVPRDEAAMDLATMLENLREALPSYMIPQAFEIVERIPVLPSGKVDRRACHQLHGRPLKIDREIVPPTTDTERMVLEVWQDLFATQEISCADHFFTDLGGYSLMASRFISFMRNDRGFPGVSVLDIYENPTIRSFAAWLERQKGETSATPAFEPVPLSRYRVAKLVQAIGIFILYGVQGLFWLGPIIAAIHFSNSGLSDPHALLVGLALHSISIPVLFMVAIATKWVVGGRFKEGDYPVWGGTFLRWWFVHRMLALVPVGFVTGTPMAGVYLRLLGAKVGKNVSFESLDVDCPDLIEIGDDSSFENSSWVRASEVAHGKLSMRPIKVGNGCVVGVRSGVAGGAEMEDGSVLQDLSCATRGTVVARDEEWAGSPARLAPQSKYPKYDPAQQPSAARLALFGTAQFLLGLVLAFLDFMPLMAVAFTLYNMCEGWSDYAMEPLFAVVLVVISCVQAWAVKWLVLGRLKPGTYDFPGLTSLRKWFAERHLELMTTEIVPVYDSLFARAWVRALGMKCGKWCEVALPRRLPYDLVEMGDESFLASEVSVGAPIRRNGKLFLERTVVGNRAFLGNDSVVPQGSHFPDESLLGVLSVAPDPSVMGDEHGQAWLGSPAFRMPNRQVHDQFAVHETYRPTRKLYLMRLGHEAFRIVLPSLSSLFILAVLVESFVAIWNETSIGVAFLCIPFLHLFGALMGTAICKLAKWVFVGKYQPSIQPLWSPFVWKVETYSAVLHDFAAPLFMNALIGTPYLNGFMRFLGAKVGHRAFINSTDFTETDLISIGDDVAINENAPLQCHLFEDRVMKMGHIKIGDRSSVGNFSVVLCESELKHDAHVGHLSLVMKGETIPSETYWAGVPAQLNGGEAQVAKEHVLTRSV